MTNPTERIKEGSVKALKYLENGDSVRRACQKAGISVTSLYHNSTAQQREQAYLGNLSASPGSMVSRAPGKRRKIIRKQQLSAVSADESQEQSVKTNNSAEIAQLEQELQNAYDYIAKLEHKLVKSIVFAEGAQ